MGFHGDEVQVIHAQLELGLQGINPGPSGHTLPGLTAEKGGNHVPQGATKTRTLNVGDQAPDFALKSHHGGETVRLSDLRGKNVFLAFYPLAWTPV